MPAELYVYVAFPAVVLLQSYVPSPPKSHSYNAMVPSGSVPDPVKLTPKGAGPVIGEAEAEAVGEEPTVIVITLVAVISSLSVTRIVA